MKKNTEKQVIRLYIWGAVVSFLLIVFDQWTKHLAVTKLKDQASFVILQGVFELHYLENQGAAFGVLQGKKLFFICITILMIIVLAYIFGKIPFEKHFYPLQAICIALFAGAIGNLIDRVMHNYVIDFFYFSLINFPVFNVADIYLTCSIALFIILLLFYYKEDDLDYLSACILPWKNKE